MAIRRKKIFAVTAKVQTAAGVDAVPSLAADAVPMVGMATLTPARAQDGKRTAQQHAGLGNIGRAAPIGRTMTLDVTLEAHSQSGGGVFAALPTTAQLAHDPFLRAAGFGRSFTLGPPAKVVYITLDDVMEVLSVYAYGNGMVYKVVDSIVTAVKVLFEAGVIGSITYSVMGTLADVAEASIAGLVLPTLRPVPWADTAAFSIGGWSMLTAAPNQLVPRKFTLDATHASTERSWAGAGGLLGRAITDRTVRATADVEVVPFATFNPFVVAGEPSVGGAAWPTITDTKIVAEIDSAKVSIITGKWMIEEPGDLDLGGISGWGLAGDVAARSIASGDGAGRELAIKFA